MISLPTRLSKLLSLLALLLLSVPSCSAPDAPGQTPAEAAHTPAPQRSGVILLQPIICTDGERQAHTAFPKHLVDECYAHADAEFFYLEPRRWNKPQALDGTLNLDKIVQAAKDDGVFIDHPGIVNLIFVSAIDGRPVTCGRGLLNGNVCFICLPKPDNESAMLEFVVAHEVGHCLGLIHSVDDPEVADDIPNIMGDGAFSLRLQSPTALTPSQVRTVKASPLFLPRVRCLDAKATAAMLLDEAFEPYISTIHAPAVRAFLGKDSSTVPDDTQAARAIYRRTLPSLAREFTPAETEFLRKTVHAIMDEDSPRWPLLKRLPWHFAKVDNSFCDGFPHTRGLSILFCEGLLRRMMADPVLARNLLLHEKLHVCQRFYPKAFERTFAKTAGYIRLHSRPAGLDLVNYVPNPDALQPFYALQDAAGRLHLPWTTLRNPQAPRMGHDFQCRAFALASDAHAERPSTIMPPGRAFPEACPELCTSLCALRNGHDHPNESAAYLFADHYQDPEATLPSTDPLQMRLHNAIGLFLCLPLECQGLKP